MPEPIVTLNEELLRSRVLREACMFVGDKTSRIVGSIAEVFPDGNSALMIVTARLKRGAPIPGRNAAGRVTAPEGEPGAVRKCASFLTAPAGVGATT